MERHPISIPTLKEANAIHDVVSGETASVPGVSQDILTDDEGESINRSVPKLPLLEGASSYSSQVSSHVKVQVCSMKKSSLCRDKDGELKRCILCKEKYVHLICTKTFCERSNVEVLEMDNNPVEFCGLMCWKKHIKEMKKSSLS